jgi:hypothetical protein
MSDEYKINWDMSAHAIDFMMRFRKLIEPTRLEMEYFSEDMKFYRIQLSDGVKCDVKTDLKVITFMKPNDDGTMATTIFTIEEPSDEKLQKAIKIFNMESLVGR